MNYSMLYDVNIFLNKEQISLMCPEAEFATYTLHVIKFSLRLHIRYTFIRWDIFYQDLIQPPHFVEKNWDSRKRYDQVSDSSGVGRTECWHEHKSLRKRGINFISKTIDKSDHRCAGKIFKKMLFFFCIFAFLHVACSTSPTFPNINVKMDFSHGQFYRIAVVN